MTYRMGLLMPDRFAAAAAYVGPPAYQLWAPPAPPAAASEYEVAGQTNNIVHERRSTFLTRSTTGRGRAGARGGRARSRRRRSATLGNPHPFYFYPAADHFALILADEWGHTRDFLDQHPTRNLSPDEVRYKRYPSMDLPQHGLRFDGAYWVDGWTVRTPARHLRAGRVVRVGLGTGGRVHARPRPRARHDAGGDDRVPGPAAPRHRAGH